MLCAVQFRFADLRRLKALMASLKSVTANGAVFEPFNETINEYVCTRTALTHEAEPMFK